MPLKPLAERRDDELLLPSEVASYYRVDTKTVGRWAKEGKIPHIRTIGGHRRYKAADIKRLLYGS
jgi:excisionase family DNA binding protein